MRTRSSQPREQRGEPAAAEERADDDDHEPPGAPPARREPAEERETAPASIASAPRTRTAVLRRSASGSHRPLVRLHAWSWLSIWPHPLAKVAS